MLFICSTNQAKLRVYLIFLHEYANMSKLQQKMLEKCKNWLESGQNTKEIKLIVEFYLFASVAKSKWDLPWMLGN